MRYDDGVEREMVLAVRDYLIDRQPPGALSEAFEAAGNTMDMDASGGESAEARVHTVSITCPEGFPVDMFLESVQQQIKSELSRPQSGQV